MIENVDPEDTAVLDEIDARFWCWIEGHSYAGTVNGKHLYEHEDGSAYVNSWQGDDNPCAPKYTSSWDASEAVRPKGWVLDLLETFSGKFACMMEHENGDCVRCISLAKTAALTKLHAIVQAIAKEREKNAVAA